MADVNIIFRGAGGRFRSASEVERAIANQLASQLAGGRRYIEADELFRGGGGSGGMTRSSYIVGSNLLYASRWIDEGWRYDMRTEAGEVHINYASPPDAQFLQAGAEAAAAEIRVDELDFIPVGVLVDGYARRIADDAAQAMRNRLNAITYSRAPYNPNTKRSWERTLDLYNSIQVQKLA